VTIAMIRHKYSLRAALASILLWAALAGTVPLAAQERLPGRFGDPDNRFVGYKLSYIQSDRAAALLKVLGYSVIEFQASGSQKTVYDKIFEAVPPKGDLRLPVVVRLIDSDKTSLLDPVPDGVPGGYQPGGGGAGSPGAPLALGGLFLDRITDGVPQQRLLIVYDRNNPAPMQALLNLLRDEIDIPAQQILIEALVIELDQDRLRDVGVDFTAKKNDSGVSFDANPGFAYNFVKGAVQPFELAVNLKALITRGQAQVLSRPSVLVLDGRQARIQVGEKIPYTSNIAATNTGTLSSTDYLTTGIVLNLRPRASEDGSAITMQVETLISSSDSGASNTTAGVLVAPRIQSREVQTLVRVANDTPFIVGGLINTNDQTDTRGVAGLSRLPVIGFLFRKEKKTQSKK
jgi:hypothetical protein